MPARPKNNEGPAIVWFREDLRVDDNPALHMAADSGFSILPLFILDEESQHLRPKGGAQRWWLHHSLRALDKRLRQLKSRLILRRGAAMKTLLEIAEDSGSPAIYWNKRYDPGGMAVDAEVQDALARRGLEVHGLAGRLMHEPDRLLNKSGKPYKVYTPFWRAFEHAGEPREPLPAPSTLTGPNKFSASDDLSAWKLLPTKPDWSTCIAGRWTPGEANALSQLHRFIDDGLDGYAKRRDDPADDTGTSRLSPHLAFGEISPHRIWHETRSAHGIAKTDLVTFRKELAWREFCAHLLHHFPGLASANYDSRFDRLKWRGDEAELKAWQQGMTGYPIVDAGMRQLWQTGWMHNRVRMIVASFLTKDLLVDWREGEVWFWDTLVDADAASNASNWQWVAGSGADAAPYFRIFNPVLQGEKFDHAGDYVRKFVPEIAELPDRFLHKPWEAPSKALEAAGIELGKTYPKPIVDHKTARHRALAAFEKIKAAA